MFIQSEETPNPDTLKFLPGVSVLEGGTSIDFTNADEADASSPLASRLFTIEGVEAVFFGHDFISVSKDEEMEWYQMKPAILGIIMEHFTAGLPVMSDGATDKGEASDAPNIDDNYSDDEKQIITQILDLLETRVRPAVAQDGGDIVFHAFDKGIVYLSMRGACAGCPSSTATLKMGIENLLRHYIPEVIEVRPYQTY